MSKIFNTIASILLCILIFSLIYPFSKINAASYSFDYQLKSTITSDLKLVSEYNVTITNVSGGGFIDYTSLSYPLKPESVVAKSGNDTLSTTSDKDMNGNYIIKTIQSPVLNKGGKISYTLIVTTSEAVEKKGNIFDVYIPEIQLDDKSSVSKNLLYISKNLPPLKYISKTPVLNEETKKLDEQNKTFTHYALNNSASLSLILGETSKYTYKLSIIPKDNVVYVPSSFQNQKITVTNLNVSPKDTFIDKDSNVALTFDQDIHEVNFTGEAEIQTDRYKSDNPQESATLDNTFWEYDNRLNKYKDIANENADTSTKVKDIIKALSQSFSYTPSDQKAERVDIKKLLDKPGSTNTLDISDLLITILRSSNINARLVGGFVDAQLQSKFNNNGLHFWIEYYDSVFGGWKSADPALQFISPNDNYYDGVGLSHIAVFKSNTGLNIPYFSIYIWEAQLVGGSVTSDEQISVNTITDKVISGKDKNISIEVKNTGNTLAKVNYISTSIDNLDSSVQSTVLNKYIFPNQNVALNSKIKNDNYYEDKVSSITSIITTDNKSTITKKNIKFEKSSPEIWIAGGILLAVISIIASTVIITRKKSKKRR